MSNLKKILIFISTYNEIRNIRELILEIKKYNTNVDILIIDDNSPDGTSHEILRLKKEIRNLFLITREKKLGLDSAHKLGYKFALEKNMTILSLWMQIYLMTRKKLKISLIIYQIMLL